ncbi:hypothetical protein AALO_G00232880, partial [Alosa alosa]
MESSSSNPPSYFGWSIFTTFCCLPLGVAALFFSNEVKIASTTGDTTKAAEASRKAKLFNIIGLAIGAILPFYH